MTIKERKTMKYVITQPIQTEVSYEVEAPEGISMEELHEIVAYKNLELEHLGFMRCEVKAMYQWFMDNAVVQNKDGDYIYE